MPRSLSPRPHSAPVPLSVSSYSPSLLQDKKLLGTMLAPQESDKMPVDAPTKGTEVALASLHFVFPIVVFVYYIVTTLIAVTTLQDKAPQNKHVRRRVITALLFLIVTSYFGQFLALMIHSIIEWKFLGEQDTIISLLSCILVFGVEFGGLAESENPVWHPYIGSFVLALLFDPAIQTLSYLARSPGGFPLFELIDTGIAAARFLFFLLAIIIYLTAPRSAKVETGTDAERQGLLKPDEQADGEGTHDSEQSTGDGYGSTSSSETATENDDDATQKSTTQPKKPESAWERRDREAGEKMAKKLKENGNWFSYTKRFLV